MRAVGYKQPLPITESESLLDLELPDPRPTGRDLLVEVKAVSVNPVDTKVRRATAPAGDGPGILGFDAVGVVAETGDGARLFKPGDKVWYAGVINRPGTNAQLHLVDERIVGRAPESLDDAAAAAMPLTTITAWELLFHRFGVAPGKQACDETLLIVGAAGGVGSILTQLAVRLTPLTVIGTASREATADWVREMGAHHVIDHGKPLSRELDRIGIRQVSHVASLTRSDLHFEEIVESLAPQGKLGLIDDPGPIDVGKLKWKSLSLHWELMFTRPLYATADMDAQHRLLNEAAALVDTGVLHSTLGDHYGHINAENLKRAHAHIEAGKARGKLVLEGFGKN